MAERAGGDIALRMLEKLVKTLLSIKFETQDDFWRLQTDLLELQVKIQRRIGEVKVEASSSKAARRETDELRRLRWHARRLGDAIAWMVLRAEKHIIYPLSENDPVPIDVNDGHGRAGLLGTAVGLWREGWGIPILHDITDILRVGDISFATTNAVKTVEIKAHYIGDRTAEDGERLSEYQVQVISDSADKVGLDLPSEPASGIYKLDRNPKIVSRLDRQVERMRTARAKQKAPPNSVTELGPGKYLLTVHHDHSTRSNWRMIRRIIRQARVNGYSSVVADGAFLYAAFYSPDRIEEDTLKRPEFVEDLKQSGILEAGPSDRRGILVRGIPPHHDERGPELSVPYFLYAVPQRAVLDILRGRLVLVSLTSVSVVVDAVRREGYAVGEAPRYIVSGTASGTDGEAYELEIGSLRWWIRDATGEFRPLDDIVNAVHAAMQGAYKHINLLTQVKH